MVFPMMRQSFRFGALLLAAAVFAASVFPSTADAARKASTKKKAHYVSARSAILIDGNHSKILFDKNSHRKVLPASTTKVMTAIVVMERMDMDSFVTISPRAVNILPSKVDLKAGERYRVRDLLYAALLNSANDAAIALAEATAGSEEKFVALMNARARQLGAKETLFANAHGLPSDDPQYTTAYDMALMFREAMKNKFFVEAIQDKFWVIRSEAGRKIALKSHNKALFKGWKANVYGKTGYTNAAQACFVGYVTKNEQPLIIAVFGCSERWDDVKFIIERYGEVDL
jgi:D-alanyl-D-alanine carboxypeptidase (penicillin-binding protein 5/6)